MLNELQIKQYLQRIGYDSTPSADLSTLFGLQWAHITHIPYENLDILAGIPLSLKAEDLFHKIPCCAVFRQIYGRTGNCADEKASGFNCSDWQCALSY